MGWRVVAAGAALHVLIGALFLQAYGAYFVLLRAEFGWSRTVLSAAFSMIRAESGLLGPIHGWLIQRLGARRIIVVGVSLFAVGFALFAATRSLLTFFLAVFVAGLGASLTGSISITSCVVNWFRRRRALALGITASGLSLGGLLVPALAVAMERFGWRGVAFASSLAIAAIGLPIALSIRARPEDVGLRREDVDAPLPNTRAARPAPDLAAREAVWTGAFWALSIGHASAVVVVSAVLVHLVPHVTDTLGYSLAVAGTAVAVMGAMQVVGHLGGGYLGDRLDQRAIAFVCMWTHASAVLVLVLTDRLAGVYVFAVLHGLAWGVRGPLMQALRADVFGTRAFATIMGLSSLVVMVGTTSGPIIVGAIHDAVGSYRVGFTVVAGIAAAGSIAFALVRPPEAGAAAPSPRSP